MKRDKQSAEELFDTYHDTFLPFLHTELSKEIDDYAKKCTEIAIAYANQQKEVSDECVHPYYKCANYMGSTIICNECGKVIRL